MYELKEWEIVRSNSGNGEKHYQRIERYDRRR